MAVDSIYFRRFDLQTENPEAIFDLCEKVYGSSLGLRARWNWEIHQHPYAGEIVAWVAEAGDGLVGMTVRMPVNLLFRGKTQRACFACNSMVDPSYRGRGIIGRLYSLAAEPGVIQLSKGTATGMYRVLKRLGYRDIRPNTFQVRILAPFAWVLTRLGRSHKVPAGETRCFDTSPFQLVGEFGENFDRFTSHAISRGNGGILKDSRFMNWRYLNIPHRRYFAYFRESPVHLASCVVLRLSGVTAMLVDILWDGQQRDEPAAAIRFARRISSHLGAIKLVAWGTSARLRIELRRQLFFDNGETPNFAYFEKSGEFPAVDCSGMHFVHGDGDVDYL